MEVSSAEMSVEHLYDAAAAPVYYKSPCRKRLLKMNNGLMADVAYSDGLSII